MSGSQELSGETMVHERLSNAMDLAEQEVRAHASHLQA